MTVAKKPRSDPGQFIFAFEPPSASTGPAALAGLEQRLSAMCSEAMRCDPRPREVLAAEVSVLLDETVSREMLDAYASPARAQHKVIMSRALALVAVTARHDLLDPRMREIGAVVLVGEELHTARLGQIDREIEHLKVERRRIAGAAPLIGQARVMSRGACGK